MSDVLKRAVRAYLLLLRSIGSVAFAIGLFISAGALIVLPLWYVSTHFPIFYSITVPVLVLGALSILGIRGLQRRAREGRTKGPNRHKKAIRLRLVAATVAALLSVYFGAAVIFGGEVSALIPAFLAACVAAVLAAGLKSSRLPGLPTGAKDRER